MVGYVIVTWSLVSLKYSQQPVFFVGPQGRISLRGYGSRQQWWAPTSYESTPIDGLIFQFLQAIRLGYSPPFTGRTLAALVRRSLSIKYSLVRHTLPETNSKHPWKWMVGKLCTYLLGPGLFSGANSLFALVRHNLLHFFFVRSSSGPSWPGILQKILMNSKGCQLDPKGVVNFST